MWCRLVILFIFAACSLSATELKIAFVADGRAEEVAFLRKGMERELTDLLEGEIELVFSDEELFVGTNTRVSVEKALTAAMNDPEWDMIITLGAISSFAATQKTTLTKPTYAPFILSVDLQQVPLTEQLTSGVRNLNYLSFQESFSEWFSMFQKLTRAKRVAIVGRETIEEAIFAFQRKLEVLEKEYNTELSFVPLGIDGSFEVENIPSNVEGIFLIAFPIPGQDSMHKMAQELVERKIASMSIVATPYIEEGFLMSLAPKSSLKRLFRRVALNVQRALQGQDLANFPVFVDTSLQLSLNMDTARELNIQIPFDLYVDATIVQDETKEWSKPFSLQDAVILGLQQNTPLAAKWREVTAGMELVQVAKSELKPKVDLGGFFRVIDFDRAQFSPGIDTQTLVTGLINGRQMIYSNSLIGNYCIERFLQKARLSDFHSTYLDTVFQIASAYLEVLQRMTVTRIQRNNLDLTRSNLLLAQQRVRVGIARASEIYRWETQISENRTSLIRASFQVKQAQTTLNRLLNLDQTEKLQFVDVPIGGEGWLFQPEWFATRFNNDQALERLNEFTVAIGSQVNPKVYELLALVQARKEELGVRDRDFYAPDVFLGGNLTERAYRAGAGTASPKVNNIDWGVELSVQYRFYDGGGKMARFLRAKEELLRTQFELENLYEVIEESIRKSVFQVTSSYAAIDLTKEALVAAQKNLSLITNSYSQGTTQIIDLLDAQNQVLVAELRHTNAMYGFLLDYVALQRQMGLFDFLMDEQERKYYKKELDSYVQRFSCLDIQ